jgi:hypothetical protein
MLRAAAGKGGKGEEEQEEEERLVSLGFAHRAVSTRHALWLGVEVSGSCLRGVAKGLRRDGLGREIDE